MSRLSRGKKREHERAARPAAPVATPVAVHVPADGAGASVGGVPVHPAPGEEIQQTVLSHLHRIALASGHPVLATVTDERIGYVVPLQVHTDGSSTFAAEPLRTAPPDPPAEALRPGPAPRPEDDSVTHVLSQTLEPAREPDTEPPSPKPAPTFPPPAPPEPHSEPLAGGSTPHSESAPAFPLRALPESSAPSAEAAPVFPVRELPGSGSDSVPRTGGSTPYGESAPAFPLRAVSESQAPSSEVAPTFALRALPEPAGDTPLGTAVAPTGVFGPAPVMDASPADVNAWPVPPASAERAPAPGDHAPVPGAPGSAATPHEHRRPDPDPADSGLDDPEPKPTSTPARGFDAVAEAVLGEDPRTAAGEAGAVLLAEPLARVNEAVKEGRIEEAAALAERTVADASGTLGPEHPEVLRVRELTAYIAYLAGDPLRSFGISLGLARIRRRAGDAAAAYGDVQSAAAAWRAVRDPEQGLRLGRDLIDLWTELTAEDGPAADDIEELESARARMGRLAERARDATPPSPS
ncbi:tetratricopeptide repeat protein [Streptomyces sp. NPDC056821]|uniref:tetratricopeptide repeat protein n=1 Tax=unclassified Streptomyces TaxID=2593676 RepID=UPI0036BF5177